MINGASIPKTLWSVVGPPFVGDYRRASVVHDVACEERSAPHEEVHRMFYHAMRADGVSWRKANIMYQAVKRFRPTWSRNGGDLKSQPHDAQAVRSFVDAVASAADKLGDGEDLAQVEQLADQILLQKQFDSNGQSGQTHGSEQNETKPVPKSAKLSRVKVKRGGGTSQDKSHNSHEASKSSARRGNRIVARGLSKYFEGAARLCEFREDTVRCLREPGQPDSVDSEDVSLMGAIDFSQLISDGQLGKSHRLRLVDQALLLIEDNYVHRPPKESMYAINPVQQLRLLRESILRAPESSLPSVLDFHGRLLKIFLSTRDLHTNYLLPSPFGNQTAFLPFLVEDFFNGNDGETRRFLVTRVAEGFDEPPFGIGVEILRWNGVSMGLSLIHI